MNTSPDVVMVRLWKKIPPNIKCTFFSALLVGILAHMYFITNDFPNHDALILTYNDLIYTVRHGRWFSPIAQLLSSRFKLPWLNGVLGIVYLSLAACFIASCLKIKGALYSTLLGALCVTFPAVMGFIMYGPLFDLQYVSVLLGCAGVFLTMRWRYGFALGAILIALSLADYQAFFSIYACMFVVALIFDVLDGQLIKTILIRICKYLGCLILGLIIYLLSVRLSLWLTGFSISDYMGLDSMGSILLERLPRQIANAYLGVYKFFFQDVFNLHYAWFKYIFAVCAVIITIWITRRVMREKLYKEPVRLALLVLLLVALPLAADLVFIMSAEVDFWVHTCYAFVLLPIFALGILEKYTDTTPAAKQPRMKAIKPFQVATKILGAASQWFVVVFGFILIFNYCISSNIIYQKQHLAYENTFAFYSRMTTTIQSMEGYSTDMPLYYVGNSYMNVYYPPELYKHNLVESNYHLVSTYSTENFLKHYIAFPNELVRVSTGDWAAYDGFSTEEKAEIEQMPAYPNSGSIHIYDDAIIVMFGV